MICGARTWVSPDEVVTCERPAGHEGHEDHRPRCCIKIGGVWHIWTVEEARDMRDGIQRQLDALDPDAAIAEMERRMNDAYARWHRLSDQSESALEDRHIATLDRESNHAQGEWSVLVAKWAALVEARDAKGGGA